MLKLIATVLPNGIDPLKGDYRFSLCMNIDVNSDPKQDENDKNCSKFLEAIARYQEIYDVVTKGGIKLIFNPNPENKDSQESEIVSDKIEFESELRKELWINKYFPFIKKENENKVLKISLSDKFFNPVREIPFKKLLNSKETALGLEKFSKAVSILSKKGENGKFKKYLDLKKDIFDDKLIKELREFEIKLKGIGLYAEQLNNDHYSNNKEKYLNIHKSELEDEELTIEKIFDIISFITSNIVLQRIFGFTIDFTIESKVLDELLNYENKASDYLLKEKSFGLKFDNSIREKLGNIYVDFISPLSRIFIDKASDKKITFMSNGNDKLSSKIVRSDYFCVTNYDIPAKLHSSSEILKKSNYFSQIWDARKELDQSISKQLQEASMLTSGINIHHNNLKDAIQESLKLEKINKTATEEGGINSETDNTITNDTILLEKNVIMGNSFGVISEEKTYELGRRNCKILYNGGKKDFHDNIEKQNFIVNTDSAMKALLHEDIKEEDAKTEAGVNFVIDDLLLNWTGENIGFTTAFPNFENETNIEPKENEGNISNYSTFNIFSRIFRERFFPDIQSYERDSDSLNNTTPLIFDYSFEKYSNPKLLFGKPYQFIVVNKYKNGWGMPINSRGNKYELSIEDMLNDKELRKELNTKYFTDPNYTFKRNEPIKHVMLLLTEKLTEGEKPFEKPIPGKEGESLLHLVIKDGLTICRRYILPPSISFELAMWHNIVFDMPLESSYYWYKKYHYNPDPKLDSENIKMDEYYLDRPLPSYLPDPLCDGFKIEFFLDKERTISAEDYNNSEEIYFGGGYPNILPWELIIQNDPGLTSKKVLVYYNEHKIIIKIKEGLELYGRIRTLLTNDYESILDIKDIEDKDKKIGTGDYNAFTPPLDFTITHATKEPLINPTILGANTCNKEINSSVVYCDLKIHIEQLNLNPKKILPIAETLPTGELELYAAWEDYIDNPDQILSNHPNLPSEITEWTPELPLNKIDIQNLKEEEIKFETKIDRNKGNIKNFQSLNKKERDAAKNYSCDIKFSYDTRSTKFIEKWYFLKNISKFTGYYDKNEPKNFKFSQEPFKLILLNSKKPSKPSVKKIIPLIVRDTKIDNDNNQTVIESRGNRLRIYLDRGRLTSGKGERVGIVLNGSSNYNGDYKSNNFISKVGKDMLTDLYKPFDSAHNSSEVYLNESNFITKDPEGVKDLDNFSPKHVSELDIMTYLPKFSRDANLWYFDIEFSIMNKEKTELHNPFLQLYLVHYQENSISYNNNIESDCRISGVEKTSFVYILPSRVFTITEKSESENLKKVNLSLTFAESSIAYKSATEKRTKFYASIQESRNGIIWDSVDLIDKNKDYLEIFEAEEILKFQISKGKDSVEDDDRYKMHRLIVLEMENYAELVQSQISSYKFSDFVENEKNRIVGINIVKLEKIYP